MSDLKIKNKMLAGFAFVFVGSLIYLWFSSSTLNVAPELELITVKGEKIQLSSLRGQPLLITFWATSCPSCIKEIPLLIKLHHKYAAQGLKIIAISMPYDRPDYVMEMAKQKALPYTVAMDITRQAVKTFGDVNLTPTTFIIAANGTIVQKKIGVPDMPAIEKQIQQLLVLNTDKILATRNLQPIHTAR